MWKANLYSLKIDFLDLIVSCSEIGLKNSELLMARAGIKKLFWNFHMLASAGSGMEAGSWWTQIYIYLVGESSTANVMVA